MTQIGRPIRRHRQVPDRPPLQVPDPTSLPPAPPEPAPTPAPPVPVEQPAGPPLVPVP